MFIRVFIIALLAGMSPGPDFFLVMKNSLCCSRKIGIASSSGIAAALTIHSAYTIAGIALIIQHYRFLYVIIQLFGALYLAYLGIRTIFSTFKKIKIELEETCENNSNKSIREGFINGFLCNLLNPKAFVFFLSIFSQFISPDMSKWMEFVYGIEVVLTIGLWFVLLSVFVSLKGFRRFYERIDLWLERIFGTILIFFAIKVIKSTME